MFIKYTANIAWIKPQTVELKSILSFSKIDHEYMYLKWTIHVLQTKACMALNCTKPH